jgi:hypothetical protein
VARRGKEQQLDLTGLRYKELPHIRWGQIDLQKKTMGALE